MEKGTASSNLLSESSLSDTGTSTCRCPDHQISLHNAQSRKLYCNICPIELDYQFLGLITSRKRLL